MQRLQGGKAVRVQFSKIDHRSNVNLTSRAERKSAYLDCLSKFGNRKKGAESMREKRAR